MPNEKPNLNADLMGRLSNVLTLTHIGMVAEQVARAFWPLWTLICVVLGILMLGLHDFLATETIWAASAVVAILAIGFVIWGVRRFRWPRRRDAMYRVDATMPQNPFRALLDRQAVGAGDEASAAVWAAHRKRMLKTLETARPVSPELSQRRSDPYALRYVGLLTLSLAILFGSLGSVQSVAVRGGGDGLATGPTWEGWMQPPTYTGLPTVYLNDITAEGLDAPEGAKITLRMYGEVGALSIDENISGRDLTPEQAAETVQDFAVLQSGRLAVDGPGGRMWQVAMIPDIAPTVRRDGEVEMTYDGESTIPFTATDDHGVVSGTARFVLDLAEVDRRYGRAIDPEPREVLEVPLPMPVTGNRTEFTEPLVGNFSQHPWANLPVKLELSVQDARGQTALSEPETLTLPGRRFFDPVARAVIEQRQSLLWNRDNAAMISQVLRAVTNRGEDLFRKDVQALRLRQLLNRIETLAEYGLSDEQVEEISLALWDLAIELEEGDLEDARQRMQRAQERLEEAMRNGASDEEIAELMQELREATQDYMRQLSREQQRQAEQNGEQQPMDPNNTIEMSQDDIQRMMDRIQELMEQGRMDEAMEAMRQFQEMMENMQITQGQGQGGQSPGEQAMEGLSETLRDQQELSDEAFRDLNRGEGQDGQQPGQQQGQQQQPGQQPGPGQGQQQPGQQGPGQGQGDQADGEGGQSLEQSLADRQRSLRDELNRQRRNLPGQGTEAGNRAMRSLEDAEGAMDRAEDALRDGELGRAIDQQSQAMEALREGLRNLGEAMQEQAQQQQGGQQGFAEGGDPQEQRDPLGRNQGTSGRVGTDEGLLQGEDVYRRAEELLGELRRRSGETDRPEAERNYLERLLDRF